MKKVPNWLRWILFIPASLLAAIIIPWLFQLFTPGFAEGWLTQSLRDILVGCVFVLAGGFVAPRNRLGAFISCGLVVLVTGFNLAAVLLVPHLLSTPPGETILATVLTLGGAIYATWQIAHASEEELSADI